MIEKIERMRDKERVISSFYGLEVYYFKFVTSI